MSKWTKTTDKLPGVFEKGKPDHIWCWIVLGNYVELCPWNTYHQCWDDADMDDHQYDATRPSHWMLADIPNPPKSEDNPSKAGE